jgi:hypothetical protein
VLSPSLYPMNQGDNTADPLSMVDLPASRLAIE